MPVYVPWLSLIDIDGQAICTAYPWRKALLSFLREANCPFCSARRSELLQHHSAWREAGLIVIVVLASGCRDDPPVYLDPPTTPRFIWFAIQTLRSTGATASSAPCSGSSLPTRDAFQPSFVGCAMWGGRGCEPATCCRPIPDRRLRTSCRDALPRRCGRPPAHRADPSLPVYAERGARSLARKRGHRYGRTLAGLMRQTFPASWRISVAPAVFTGWS